MLEEVGQKVPVNLWRGGIKLTKGASQGGITKPCLGPVDVGIVNSNILVKQPLQAVKYF